MQANENRWMELCKQAAIERDPVKFYQLIKEINDLLEVKQARLDAAKPDDRS